MSFSRMKLNSAVVLMLLLSAVEAKADRLRPTIEYSTTGVIDGPFSGSPVVTFEGVPDGTLTTGNPFNLGAFTVSPSSTGSTSYAGRFEIVIRALSVDGVPLLTDAPKAIIRGHIEGSVGSGTENNLKVYFGDTSPFSGFPFGQAPVLLQAGSISENITINGSLLMSLPSSISATSVPVSGIGLPSPVPVPEPTTLALFLVGFSIVLNKLWKGYFSFSD